MIFIKNIYLKRMKDMCVYRLGKTLVFLHDSILLNTTYQARIHKFFQGEWFKKIF